MAPSEIMAAVGEARRAAQSAGVDPVSADNAFAEIDAAAAIGGGAFELWLAIARQIGRTDQNPTLHELLKELQRDLQEKTIAAEIRRLREITEQAPDRGWREWVITQVQGIAAFRLGFCVRVAEGCNFIPAVGRPTPDELRAAVGHMYQSRWVEAYRVLLKLGELEFLPDYDRATILFILGHISLLWFYRGTQAKRFFDKAEGLAPGNGLVKLGLGDFWRDQQNMERAISCWQGAADATPAVVLGFVRQAEHYESQDRLGDAEQLCRHAIAADPGESDGYTSLFKLYGRAKPFEQHQRELQPLMELAVAVGDPSGRYDQYLELGFVYEQNDQYQQACKWYEAAIGLDETRPDGYSAMGRLREKEGRTNEALTAFQRATDAAPECPHGGTWELAAYYVRQEDWEKAEAAFLRVPQTIAEWANLVRAQIARAKSKRGNEAEAEQELLGALRADKENESAKSVLNQIATDHYTSGDEGAARRIYDQVLDILGDAYRGDYHNDSGNLAYWRGDNADATEAYRQAIDASPENPVYRRNLAGALRNLKDYRASEQALDAAYRIDRDKRAYNDQIALLRNAEGNDYYEKGDFREAREKYEESTRSDPSLAVVHSNLAKAWERQPGAEIGALDRAIESLELASKLQPEEESHQREIERLQRKKKLAPVYGLNPLGRLQPFATPLAVEIAADLVAFVSDDQEDKLRATAASLIGAMRERLQKLSGLVVPGLRIRDNSALHGGNYVFVLNDIPLASGGIDLNKRFFPGAGDSLAALNVTGETASSQQTGCEGFWIDSADWEKMEGTVPKLWEIFEYPLRHLEHVLRHHLPELLGHQEVIGILEREIPAAAAVLRRRPNRLSRLTDVCRGLAMEQVPLTPFLEIYSAFLSATDSRPQDIVESIRSLPQFRDRLPGNDGQRPVFTLSPHFEAELGQCLYPGNSGRVLAIEPRACQKALEAISNGIGAGAPGVIIVGNGELRPFLRRLVEAQLPDTPILSRREARPIGEAKSIEFDGEDEPANPDFHLSGSARGEDAEAESSANFAPIPDEIAIVVFLPREFGRHEGSPLHERIWRGIAAFLPGGFGQAATKSDDQALAELFSQMRDRLYNELGVLLPQVRLQRDDNLPDDLFRFRLNHREFPAAHGLEDTENSINQPHIEPEILTAENVVRAVEVAVRRNAAMFQTLELTQYSLDVLNENFPDLVKSALTRLNVHQICKILCNLLDEEINVTDMRSTLEGILAVNGVTAIDPNHYIVFTPPAENLCLVASGQGTADLTASDYANFVRTWRKRYMSYKYARGSDWLSVLLLDSTIENRLREKAVRPLTEADKRRLTNAVGDALGRNSGPPMPVILTDMDIRRELWKLLAAEFPKLGILCYQDLALDTNIRPLERISCELEDRVMPII